MEQIEKAVMPLVSMHGALVLAVDIDICRIEVFSVDRDKEVLTKIYIQNKVTQNSFKAV